MPEKKPLDAKVESHLEVLREARTRNWWEWQEAIGRHSRGELTEAEVDYLYKRYQDSKSNYETWILRLEKTGFDVESYKVKRIKQDLEASKH